MVNKMKISVMGFLCIDIINSEDQSIEMLGGSAGNVASILKGMGNNVQVWTPEYVDSRGEMLIKELKERDLELVLFTKTKIDTPYIYLQYDPLLRCEKYSTRNKQNGARTSKVCLPTKTQIVKKRDRLEGVNLLYTDRMSDGIHCAIDIVSDQGTWIFYEPNGCRTYGTFLNVAQRVDVIKLSSEKIYNQYIERLKKDAADSKLKIILVTEGDKGAKFCFKEGSEFSQWMNVRLEPEKVTDCTGAGDWLSACFMHLFLKRYPFNCDVDLQENELREILQISSKIATYSCKFMGSQLLLNDTRSMEIIYRILDEKR